MTKPHCALTRVGFLTIKQCECPMVPSEFTQAFKTCPACKESKPATVEYYLPNTCRPGTWRPKCRPCQKAYSAAYTLAKKAKPNPIPDPTNAPIKTCRKCHAGLSATLENFDRHFMGLHGLDSRCRPCRKEENEICRAREDQKIRQKAWRDANKDKVRETNKAYRAAGYTSTQAVSKWREENIEHSRAKESKKMREYRATKPWFNLKARISSRINIMLKNGHGPKARRSTFDLLGYSREDLMAHIEAQFTDGMSWDRLLASEIHIDHIIPLSFFKAEDASSIEFKMCWSLSNLRPMWAAENMAKGDTLPPNFTELWNKLYCEATQNGS